MEWFSEEANEAIVTFEISNKVYRVFGCPVVFPEIQETTNYFEEMPYLRWIYQLQLYSCCNYKNIENAEYYNSEDILIHANRIDPSDIKTVNLLLKLYMDGLWFGSHHLPEYILLNEREVNVLFNKVNHFIEKYESRIENVESILEDINYYNELYKSWFKYKGENRNISFMEWCKDNEKKYSWVKAYYYDRESVRIGESVLGAIAFITPEAYPHCLWEGKKITIQEGNKVVGYATVVKIFNELLRLVE